MPQNVSVQPIIEEGDIFDLTQLILTQKFTEPPNRYSAAGLIKKLEELGIGRPSTYANIISTLGDRKYVESVTGSMKPTLLGMQVARLLTDNFDESTSSHLTAEMEENLDKISRGESDYETVLNDFWWEFKNEVETKSENLKEDKSKYRSIETDVKCPTCDSQMELKIGRFGEYFQCVVTHEHQFPKNFKEYEAALKDALVKYQDQTSGKVCVVCGQGLIVRVSKASLKPYIACKEYRVGNKHTITNIDFPEGDPNASKGKRVSKFPLKKSFSKSKKK